jgi:OHCU decarboxylase
MIQSLNRLNGLSANDADAEFLKCCGSTQWAQAMTQARPFEALDDFLAKADRTWWSLSEADWLEAFRAHPKIGEKKAATAQSTEAQKWSAQEQSGVAQASASTISELAERNRQYEDRFGFIFIVCASGKSSEEMLAIINERIGNDAETELRTAAAEQSKITRLRLEKLLNQ